MNGLRRVAALLSSMLVCTATQSFAGTMTPYQAVLVGWGLNSILLVDMATGTYTEIPIEGIDGVTTGTRTIAADSNGAIHVYFDFFLASDNPVVGSMIATIDLPRSEWMTMRLEGEIDSAEDMDFTPDGNLIVGAEFGLYDLDLTAKKVRRSRFQPTGEFNGDGATIGIETDSSGSVIFGALTVNSDESILFRQSPEAEFPERFDTGILLKDFILDRDGSLIGVWQDGTGFTERALYRLNFDTKGVDLLFESDLLRGTERIKLDPDGRIVALSQTSDTEARLVRVDLELGTAELIAELEGYYLSNMELRIIPEPSSVVLLILGCTPLVAYRSRLPNVR